jgi:hypothetical protein
MRVEGGGGGGFMIRRVREGLKRKRRNKRKETERK